MLVVSDDLSLWWETLISIISCKPGAATFLILQQNYSSNSDTDYHGFTSTSSS